MTNFEATDNITVYNYDGTTYNKTILKNCFWRQKIELVVKGVGVMPVDIVKLFIPIGYENTEYVRSSEFANKGWTIKTGADKKGSYIVRGKCKHDFPSLPSKKELEDSMREFMDNNIYHKAKTVRDTRDSTPNTWHVEVML